MKKINLNLKIKPLFIIGQKGKREKAVIDIKKYEELIEAYRMLADIFEYQQEQKKKRNFQEKPF